MPTPLDQFAIRPAQRNPRPDFAAEHPFAPTGWDPTAAIGDPTAGGAVDPTSPAASFADQNTAANSGIYALGSFGDQNNKANLGITSPGTFARQNAEANGTTFKDPVSGPGVKSAPTYPTVPQVSYNAVNGIGTPATGPAPARATRTLTQGQPMNLPAGPVFDLVGKGDSQPAAQPSRSGQSLALSALLGGYGTPPEQARGEGRHSGTVDPLNALGDTGMVLNAARGVDALRTQTAAEQDLRLLDRAGMIPQPNDTPEVRSNKLAYLDQRVREQAMGKTSRAPGSPVYNGPAPVVRSSNPMNALSIADMASLANRITATAGMKPVPGSAGYKTVDIPGAGKLVQDTATGEYIGSGQFSKISDPKDKQLSDAETQNIAALQQSNRDLDSLEEAFASIKDADFGGPVSGRLWNFVPGDKDVSRLNNLVVAATPNLARGVFRERGVLTDADVERYQKLLPNIKDTKDQRAQKLADLRSRLAATTNETLATLEASGRDVADLRNHIFGGKQSASKETQSSAGKASSVLVPIPPGGKVKPLVIGERHKQNGIIYQWDGKEFKPVQ